MLYSVSTIAAYFITALLIGIITSDKLIVIATLVNFYLIKNLVDKIFEKVVNKSKLEISDWIEVVLSAIIIILICASIYYLNLIIAIIALALTILLIGLLK